MKFNLAFTHRQQVSVLLQQRLRGENGEVRNDHQIGKVWCRGKSVMHSYFRNEEATKDCLVDGWLDTGDMGYTADGYLFIVGRAKDMIIINGKNLWPQDIEWAVEQLPGFNHGDIAAFSVDTESGEEAPAVLQARRELPVVLRRPRRVPPPAVGNLAQGMCSVQYRMTRC